MHILSLMEGPSAPKKFVLRKKTNTLGRAEGNDILLDSPKISKRHLLLVVEPNGQVLLEDLNSRNGVFVDQRPETKAILKPGAKIKVGEYLFRYDFDEAQERKEAEEESGVPSGFKLWVANGHGYFDVLKMETACLYLGKSKSNEIMLMAADVSQRHAMLRWNNDSWEIHDLDSTNGVFVNGSLVEKATLSPGDRVRIAASFLLSVEAPRFPINKAELEADARREIKKPKSYLPRSTQIALLLMILLICIALILLVVLKTSGRI